MEPKEDYEALIRELLAGIKVGWNYKRMQSWLSSNELQERALAQWLRENGAAFCGETKIRNQLTSLAILGLCELAQAASEILQQHKPIPTGSQKWFDRGNYLLGLGKEEEAIIHYDRAIELYPNFEQAWSNKGAAMSKLGRYEEATSCFERSIEIQSDYHEAWFSQGIILAELGRHEEAIASYDRAIDIAPNYYQYWYNRGVVIYKVRRFEETIASYDRAIELKSNLDQAWYNRGIALGDLGRYTDAISSYDRSIEIKPDNYQTWDNRGKALGLLHGYRVKIDAYYQSFKYIHPDTNPEGWIFMQQLIGRTHYYEGNTRLIKEQCDPQSYYEDALSCYHNALEILARENFPELHFKISIDISRVYLAKNNTLSSRQFQSEAINILENIFADLLYMVNPSKAIVLKYDPFHHLDEDLEICLHFPTY
jgi:tetratricopeptide (TPR) repeat protein